MFAMNKLLLFILLFTCCTHYQMFGSCSNTLVRKERNLLNMAGSLLCSKNRLHVSLLGLTQYGCFCGPGGSGKPVDEVDQCCLAHDCCYGHAQVNLKCPTKLSPYQFVCEKETVKCLSTNLCSRAACECDRLFVECLTNSQQGQSKYHFYDKKKLCPSPDAACPPISPSMSLANLQAATRAKRQTKWKAERG